MARFDIKCQRRRFFVLFSTNFVLATRSYGSFFLPVNGLLIIPELKESMKSFDEIYHYIFFLLYQLLHLSVF